MEILLIHIIYYKINSLSQLQFDYAPQVLPLVELLMVLLFLKLNTLLILNCRFFISIWFLYIFLFSIQFNILFQTHGP